MKRPIQSDRCAHCYKWAQIAAICAFEPEEDADPIFYALCAQCAVKIADSPTASALQRIENYIVDRPPTRRERVVKVKVLSSERKSAK